MRANLLDRIIFRIRPEQRLAHRVLRNDRTSRGPDVAQTRLLEKPADLGQIETAAMR